MDSYKSIMKKNFTCSAALALSLSFFANADTCRFITWEPGAGVFDGPQIMALGMSPNGRYVCGAVDQGDGFFVADLETGHFDYDLSDDPEGSELRNIDNNGLAIGYNGPGFTYSIDGTLTELDTPEGYKYVLGEDLTVNGDIMVGSLVAPGYVTYAAVSVNGGEWKMLSLPPAEELGPYDEGDSSAKLVSGDGKIIAGHISSFGPLMVWTQGEDGEYVPDPVYMKYVALTEEEIYTKPLLSMMPIDMSNNGKYILCQSQAIIDDDYKAIPVIYNTETKEITIFDEPQEADMYFAGMTPVAIADDASFIGIYGFPMRGYYGSFYMAAGATQSVPLGEAFPSFGEMFGMADSLGFVTATDMSADGSKITGYGYYSEDFFDEELPAGFASFVIDTGTGTAVDAASAVAPVSTEIYSIDGRRLENLHKGLNIVRNSDGTAKKIIK